MKTFIVSCDLSMPELKKLIETKHDAAKVTAVYVSYEEAVAMFDRGEDFFSKHREMVLDENEAEKWDNEGGGHPLNPENR